MADDFNAQLNAACERIAQKISIGVRSRGYRAANELRNASQLVLRGQRSGRRYRVPGTKSYYTASAPGEPPAVRTGAFRAGWQAKQEITSGAGTDVTVRSYIESNTRTDNGKYTLGAILEDGSSRMAPRPYQEKIQEKALPKIKKIFKEPYL